MAPWPRANTFATSLCRRISASGMTGEMRKVLVRRVDLDLPQPRLKHNVEIELLAAHDTMIPLHGRHLVWTGIAVAIPRGCAGFIVPLATLAIDQGVTILKRAVAYLFWLSRRDRRPVD